LDLEKDIFQFVALADNLVESILQFDLLLEIAIISLEPVLELLDVL
jgi:hypothetical protein